MSNEVNPTAAGAVQAADPIRAALNEIVTWSAAKSEAVHAGVKAAAGKLWLVSVMASICCEPVLAGGLPDEALGLANELSLAAGKALRWPVVRDVIDGAIRTMVLEGTPDSGPWPCPLSGAGAVRLQRPQNVPMPGNPRTVVTKPGTPTAETEMRSQELVDLADSLGEVPNTPKLNVRIELGGEPKASEAKLKANKAIPAKVREA